MDNGRKLELLQQQIDEANSGRPSDFSLWRQRTDVTLRNVLGDANPLYESFTEISYGLSIWTSDTPDSAWEQAEAGGVRQAVAILEAAKLEVELSGGSPQPAKGVPGGGQSVFVVHGHDEARKHEAARFLAACTGSEPVILHEQPNSGATIIEKFERHAADAGFAVVLGTADDVGFAHGHEGDAQPRARQNVIFELGFFFGALGRKRVALLYEPSIERPSDIDGIVRIPLDEAGAWKMLLARELNSAGIGVDWSALGR